MLTPAFAGGTVTKKFVKKTAKKIAKKIATAGDSAVKAELQPQIDAVEAAGEELADWGPLVMPMGAPDQVVATIGPFTFTAQCLDDAGKPFPKFVVSTSQDNAVVFGADGDPDFDVADGAKRIGGLASGQAVFSQNAAEGEVYTSDQSTVVMAYTRGVANAPAGSCALMGYLHRVK
jgi:hypothetical protein